MKPTLLLRLFALLLVAVPASAQQLDVARFDAAALTAPPPLDLSVAPVAAPAPARAQATPSDAGRATADDHGFSFRPILHALGGALVGGWVGYVGAQVVKSDWDKETNGTFSDQRTTWVAAGAAVGVLGSWLIGETRPPRPGPLTVERRSPRDRSVITSKEIREAGLQTALDIVTALRRDWLQTRGTNSWGESTRGTADGFGNTFEADLTKGRDKIIVYFDDIRIGGVDDMADIPASTLTSIRFVEGREATYLFGTGHAHGAIILSSESEVP